MKRVILAALVAAGGGHGLTVLPEASAAEIRVAAGTSPQEAVARVAAERGRRNERVTVIFERGDYVLEDTLRLGPDDGNVTWRAEGGGGVRFLGGRMLEASAFVKVTDREFLSHLPPERTNDVYVADVSAVLPSVLPEDGNVFTGATRAPHLYINGKPMRPARWPNEGWTHFTKAVETGVAPKGATELEQRAWKKKPGVFVYEEPRARRWDFSLGVMMNGYWTHDWDNESRRAIAWETSGSNMVVRFAAVGRYGTGGGTWGLKKRRFYVFGMREELDAPGEWYLDRKTRRLYLVPPNGALTKADKIGLALMEKPMLECKASEVSFEGIGFELSAREGVRVVGDGVTFSNCTFAALGATAISIDGNRNHVIGCALRELGGAGIRMNGGNRRKLERADSSVEKCVIRDYGNFERCYAGACVFRGCGITIRGNTICNAPHLALLYTANDSLIESNVIHHVVRETNDASAIYTGRDWTTAGNVIRGNFIHHLGNPESEGENAVMALYFDDCDCGDEITDNTFWKVPRGIMIGGGREHPVRGNCFIECNLGYSIDNRGMTWKNWNLPKTSWHLEGHAEKMRYREEPWKSRYPWLEKIMRDDPREPKYDPVENNIFVNCKAVCKLPGKDEKGMKAFSNLVMRANLVVNTIGAEKTKIDERALAGFERMENVEPERARQIIREGNWRKRQ